MKQILGLITIAMALCIAPGMVSATLVGDSVTVGHYFPDNATPLNGATPPATFSVVAGNADVYTFYNSYPFGYTVNVEADSILVDFSYAIREGTATWPNEYQTFGSSPASFNGLGVSDLNDSTGDVLRNVVVDTNMAGWDSSRLSFGDHEVLFDWKGLSFSPDTRLSATLDFGQHSPVPDPATVLLLGSGVLGLVGYGWRNRRKVAPYGRG